METTMQDLRRSRVFAGIAMIAAPLLVGAATLMSPATSSDTEETVTELAANADTLYVAILTYHIGLVLFVSVVLTLVHLLREQKPWLGQVGGLLGVTGLMLVAVFSGVYAAMAEVADLDIATGVTVMDALESNPVVLFGIAGSIAFAVSLLILAIGLLRTRTAPTWAAWLVALGAILQLAGDLAAVDAIGLAGVGALLLGLAPLGYQLIAGPDEAWTHPMAFKDIRPTLDA